MKFMQNDGAVTRRHTAPYRPVQTEASPGMTNGHPLMLPNDGTGASV